MNKIPIKRVVQISLVTGGMFYYLNYFYQKAIDNRIYYNKHETEKVIHKPLKESYRDEYIQNVKRQRRIILNQKKKSNEEQGN